MISLLENLLFFLTRLLTGAVAEYNGFSFDPIKQRIYYANHSSHMDTLILWSMVPKSQRRFVHPVAAKEYWWSSRLKKYFAENIFRAVPLARTREERGRDPLHALESVLDRGESLIIFPEGTRGDGEAIQKFKGGLYHLAAKYPHVELVPVYISNLGRVLPKGELLPVPIICSLHFGAGFTIEPEETKAALIARAQSKLEALRPQ